MNPNKPLVLLEDHDILQAGDLIKSSTGACIVPISDRWVGMKKLDIFHNTLVFRPVNITSLTITDWTLITPDVKPIVFPCELGYYYKDEWIIFHAKVKSDFLYVSHWTHFRPLNPPPKPEPNKPREFWLCPAGVLQNYYQNIPHDGWIHVREVLEGEKK